MSLLATSNSAPKSSHPPKKNIKKCPILFDWWDLILPKGDPLFVAISLRAAVLLEPLGPQPWCCESLNRWGTKQHMKVNMKIDSKCHTCNVMETGNWCYIIINNIYIYTIYLFVLMVVFFVSGLPYGVLKSNSLVVPVASPYWALVTRLLISQNFA